MYNIVIVVVKFEGLLLPVVKMVVCINRSEKCWVDVLAIVALHCTYVSDSSDKSRE